jgi:hypothetical protein
LSQDDSFFKIKTVLESAKVADLYFDAKTTYYLAFVPKKVHGTFYRPSAGGRRRFLATRPGILLIFFLDCATDRPVVMPSIFYMRLLYCESRRKLSAPLFTNNS